MIRDLGWDFNTCGNCRQCVTTGTVLRLVVTGLVVETVKFGWLLKWRRVTVRRGWNVRSLRLPLPSQDEEFRDFQGEVEAQRREPYQNADQVADMLVHCHMALPEYTPPPDYDQPYNLPPLYEDIDL